MLLKLHGLLDSEMPKIKKYVIEENSTGDASTFGAFPCSATIRYAVSVPKRLGASAVVLRIARDGEPTHDLPLSFLSSDHSYDEYEIDLSMRELCRGENDGLFYYEFLFLRGYDTLFTDSINNVDFELSNSSASKFRLLVYSDDYKTPEWFRGKTMYHIFVDRFCRGEGEVKYADDSIFNDDWHNGIVQYGEYPGAPVKNNMFFGGNFWGIIEKLDYLKSLGVGVIYLSPIFKAYSNHKYDTGDYMKIDDGFGGEKAFEELLLRARECGIRIILDGVFNHTGDDSIYFNKRGNYDGVGAYQSPESPYYKWYNFKEYPDKYESWWGIEILPKLNLANESCHDFIVGKGGVIEKYTKMGIGGWRLDVADELTDELLDDLRTTVKHNSDGEGIIIGEVWENAADKIAYGNRRRYLRGRQLDSVMNYPVRNAILAFSLWADGEMFYNILTELYSSYPKCTSDSLMNLLSTHDTERILTVLGGDDEMGRTNDELAVAKMDDEQYNEGVELLKIASVLQYTVFGVPSLFYGDEAGVYGHHDPFCRKTYPWGREDKELLEHYKKLGKIRESEKVFRSGAFNFVEYGEGFVTYERSDENGTIVISANRGDTDRTLSLEGEWTDLYHNVNVKNEVCVPHNSFVILKKKG